MSKPVPRPIDLDYGEQDENGVDLTLIRYMLSLTPIQRLRMNDEAAQSALRLMEIGRQNREKQTRNRT
jgi:hypothetical protein